MEFKGTKSKWEYKVKHRGSCKPALIQVIIPTTYYQQVLEVGTISSDDCTVPTCCKTEEHANALLISKAPEMLEMLKRVASIEGMYPNVVRNISKLIKEATDI